MSDLNNPGNPNEPSKPRPARRLRRWLIWLLLAGALLALLYAAYRPRPMLVEVADVRLGRFEQVVEEDGQLRLKQRYLIAAPTAAQLLRPHLKVGDAVRAGEVLATLAPVAPQMIDARSRSMLVQRVGSAQAARSAAQAQLQRLQTSLAQANTDLARAEQLAQAQFIAPAGRDQALLAQQGAQQALAAGRAELAMADFALAEARAALGRAEPTVGHTAVAGTAGGAAQGLWQLKSPIDGHVIKLHQDSAGPVAVGQPLLEVGKTGDASAMEAVIDVLSDDVQRIQPGAAVQLSAGRGGLVWAGQVVRTEPVAFTKVSALGIEEQRVRVLVALVGAGPPAATAATAAGAVPHSAAAALGEGYRVDARITVLSQDQVLLVPTAALVRQGVQWQVFVVRGGQAQPRAVQVADRNADVAWVRTGVAAGDSVVLYPGSTVRAGQALRVRPPT